MNCCTPCTCGHSIEEHGHDPKYPGSTACTECDCIAYEVDDDDYDDDYEVDDDGDDLDDDLDDMAGEDDIGF